MTPDDNPIPFYTLDSLEDYVLDGDVPGGFLTAVLKNDLRGAFRNADGKNRPAIGALHDFCFSYIPGRSWGSEDEFIAWHQDGGFNGRFPRGDAEAVSERFDRYREANYEAA